MLCIYLYIAKSKLKCEGYVLLIQDKTVTMNEVSHTITYFTMLIKKVFSSSLVVAQIN